MDRFGLFQELLLPFRGDAPNERRFMELRLAPLPHDGLELEARLVSTEPRETWVDLDSAVSAMDVLRHDPPPSPIHCVCVDCEATVR